MNTFPVHSAEEIVAAEAAQAAAYAYAVFGTGIPVNVVGISRGLGARVFASDLNEGSTSTATEIRGIVQQRNNDASIYYDRSTLLPIQVRYTVALLLGHHVCSGGVSGDEQVVLRRNTSLRDSLTGHFAVRFARHLTLPEEPFTQAARDGISDFALARDFDVPYAVAAERMRELSLY